MPTVCSEFKAQIRLVERPITPGGTSDNIVFRQRALPPTVPRVPVFTVEAAAHNPNIFLGEVARAPRQNHSGTATPAGFEKESRGAKLSDDSASPTENRGSGSAKNRVVKVSGSKVAKLAAVGANAVRNYDLSRAIEVLEELRQMGEGTR